MNDQPKLQVVSHKTGNLVKDDPSAAGKRSIELREARVLDDLTSTRQYMNSLAMPAAEHLSDVLTAQVKPDLGRITVARDILDRTIGKAPTELRVGPSAQATDIIKELSERDAGALEAPSESQAAP